MAPKNACTSASGITPGPDGVTHQGQEDLSILRAIAYSTILIFIMLAIVLGILFKGINVTFLVGLAFAVAASANLPAMLMMLFWKRTTKQGITAAIIVGMISSLAWILLSAQAYKDVYGWDPARAIVPFSQPAIVTIPLGFLVLIVVSLLTPRREEPAPIRAAPVNRLAVFSSTIRL